MFRSNWLLFVATVGLAILNPIHRHCYAQSSATETSEHPEQDSKPIDWSPLPDEIKSLTRAVESIKPEGKTKDEIERAKRDLDAQEGMAKWARLMYIVTALATTLTTIGVILLGFTLYFTKRASDSSDEMAKQSIIASKAAVDAAKAADITAQTMLATELPIIRPVDITSQLSRDCEIHVHAITFRNHGRTPAFPIQINIKHSVFPLRGPKIRGLRRIGLGAAEIVKPAPEANEFTASVNYACPLSDIELANVNQGEDKVWLYASLRYSDFFGNDQVTEFTWVWSAKKRNFDLYCTDTANEADD
jgi:hypothetical protein